MGNQAMGLGALRSGVNLVSGYPGTPSTECLEYIAAEAKRNDLASRGLHVEWSTNEKAALEIAAGAALAGGRALATMKQVGLNVAMDAMMSLPYLGFGGLVLLVADDPGPFSSQTEQDTRQVAEFIKEPLLDPSTPEEAEAMMRQAFELSETYHTPVIVRSVTRISHGAVSMEAAYDYQPHPISGFVPSAQWVVLPGRAFAGHNEIAARLRELTVASSTSSFNSLEQTGLSAAPAHLGVAAGGLSWAYLKDVLQQIGYQGSLRLLKVGQPMPFPESLATEFLRGLDEVIVFEELEPVIERQLLQLAGREHLPVRISGHLTATTKVAGENSTAQIAGHLLDFLSVAGSGRLTPAAPTDATPALPARPPILCAGCPHRASFYAVKQALKGRPATFSADIGCYTLGNAVPLEMVQTCVCMGGGFTVPQGLAWAEPNSKHIGFVGDSTFFASSVTGLMSAVYNQADVTLIVLNNSITAMTGGQPHPGTGQRMAATPGPNQAISITALMQAVGVGCVLEADPLDLSKAIATVQQAVDYPGVSCIVFSSPCINLIPKATALVVDPQKCTNCQRCIRQLGCPALVPGSAQMQIDSNACNACGLCAQVCPAQAIGGK